MLSFLVLWFGTQAKPFVQSDDSLAGLLHRPEVQVELGLTQKQKDLWQRADKEQKPRLGGTFEADEVVLFDPKEQRKKDADREAKVWPLLRPGQILRLQELFVQRHGLLSVTRPSVAGQLELTADQNDQLWRAVTTYDKVMSDLFQASKRGKLEPSKVKKLLVQRDADLADEITRILDGAQRAALEKMGGAPFRFSDRAGFGLFFF